MKIRHLLSGLAVVAALTGCEKNAQQGGSADADHMSRGSGGATNLKSTLPDNTGINTRDRNDITLTPGDQGGSESDRMITSTIRRAITSNDQLSTTARNIKIVTIDGKVTLRGPVNTEAEKTAIENAVKQSGVIEVDNQLEVKSNNP